jgi:hypothetical protein
MVVFHAVCASLGGVAAETLEMPLLIETTHGGRILKGTDLVSVVRQKFGDESRF